MSAARGRRRSAASTATSRRSSTSASRSAKGETVAIIGANGAGKSTLLASVADCFGPASGEVRFDGSADRPACPRTAASSAGISLVPEGRRVFPSLTVEENLRIGAYRRRRGPWSLERGLRAVPGARRALGRWGGTLSGGEQQMCAIGRALMGEPAAAAARRALARAAPAIIKAIYETMDAISARGDDRRARRAGRRPGARGRRPRLLPARGPRLAARARRRS